MWGGAGERRPEQAKIPGFINSVPQVEGNQEPGRSRRKALD